MFLKSSLYFSNNSEKYTSTAWPKIIGSLTFIMVAFMCRESKSPLSVASFICSCKKPRSAFLCITVASMISPESSVMFCFKICLFPEVSVSSILTLVGVSMVTEVSLFLKSPWLIVATCVLELDDQAPILCGFFLA